MQRVRAEPYHPYTHTHTQTHTHLHTHTSSSMVSLPRASMTSLNAHLPPADLCGGGRLTMSEEGVRAAVDSFKLIGLLIPPAHRRKLQLLIKFMRRVAEKKNLELDSSLRGCRRVVVDTFSETILKPQDLSNYDEELCSKIVEFFMDHYEEIWTPPVSLRREVEERVSC